MDMILKLLMALLGFKWHPSPTTTPAPTKQPARYKIDSRQDIVCVQTRLMELGYCDPPPDGNWGPGSEWAMRQVWLPWAGTMTDAADLQLRNAIAERIDLSRGDLAARIVRAVQARGLWMCVQPEACNIVYVEGMDVDGTRNGNEPNQFNDIRTVIRFSHAGIPILAGCWEATTEPGRYWTEHPMDPGGAFRIKFGQYKAWSVGTHHTHEALVQVAPITGYRDKNRDAKRGGDQEVTGLFGVNQHWGYDFPRADLKNSSAGCLVGRSTSGHREFMALVKSDPRYRANGAYRFIATVLPAEEV